MGHVHAELTRGEANRQIKDVQVHAKDDYAVAVVGYPEKIGAVADQINGMALREQLVIPGSNTNNC